jgi:hypothetical protein
LAAAIGEKELARRAPSFANALRKSESQDARDRHVFARFLAHTPRACHSGPASRQLPHLGRTARAVAAETFQPMCEIGIVPPKPALHDNRSDFSSLLCVAESGRDNHHAGKPGWQG